MLWKYSRKDSKVLLLATLLLFSGYALLLAQSWHDATNRGVVNTANTIGVLAGVPDNSINAYVQELDARATALDSREAALVTAYKQQNAETTRLLLVTMIGVGLLGLILLNFYLDSKRRFSLAPENTA